jgi:hypothetical protein
MLGKHTLLLGLFTLFPFAVLAQSSSSNDAATPAPAAKEERVFDITRDGNNIGKEVVDINRDGDTTIVTFKTHIAVVIMFIVVHRFDHSATETWSDGKFVSYKALTVENGDRHAVTAKAAGDKIALEVNGTESDVAGDLVFASFWNRDFAKSTTLLDPDTGRELSVKVNDLGEESITLASGTAVKAHHYEITGDLERNLWFDGDNLVRIKLYGSDHSTIMSELTPDKSN